MPRNDRHGPSTSVEALSDEDAPPAEQTGEQSEEDNSNDDAADDGQGNTQSQDVNLEQLVKKMVRFALVCEYSRIPIRRADISEKVLDPHRRRFAAVFEGAQKELRDKFGMRMEMLPSKEKVTIAQRRAAQKSEKPQAASRSWVLVSILPPEYRTPEILQPPQVPTTAVESVYIGLYSFVVSIIMLCGGSCPEARMERYLMRANADQNTPIDRTDKLLARMIKEGYIIKIKDPSGGGEEQVEYMVGPRGKVEIGPAGVAGLVKTVYADSDVEDLDQRIAKSLGIQSSGRREAQGEREVPADAELPREEEAQGRRVQGRKRRAMDDEDD